MVGEGTLYVALSPEVGQVAVTWDGADGLVVNVFTYDESVKQFKAFA